VILGAGGAALMIYGVSLFTTPSGAALGLLLAAVGVVLVSIGVSSLLFKGKLGARWTGTPTA
jgi:hypothetical protein